MTLAPVKGLRKGPIFFRIGRILRERYYLDKMVILLHWNERIKPIGKTAE